MSLNDKQKELCKNHSFDFSALRALFLNCTLKPTGTKSHTEALIDVSEAIMRANGVATEVVRPVDYTIPPGVYPDMTEHGFDKDDWPDLWKKVSAADILVIGTPIWLGEESSICRLLIERLYGESGNLNDAGQYIYYGKVGGCLVTGNEDGVKHCAMSVLYALQHLGCSIPPQADAGWIGEAGPGPAQHHLHDLEPDAYGAHAEGCRRHPGAWQSALRLGGRLPLRPPKSGLSLSSKQNGRSR